MNFDKFNISQASRTLKCISNESRLKILFNLFEKPMSVSALNKYVKISQSALSQHLNMLKLASIIDSKRNGTYVTYFIASEEACSIIAKLQELFAANAQQDQVA